MVVRGTDPILLSIIIIIIALRIAHWCYHHILHVLVDRQVYRGTRYLNLLLYMYSLNIDTYKQTHYCYLLLSALMMRS